MGSFWTVFHWSTYVKQPRLKTVSTSRLVLYTSSRTLWEQDFQKEIFTKNAWTLLTVRSLSEYYHAGKCSDNRVIRGAYLFLLAREICNGWARICKRLRSPGIESDESIPPAGGPVPQTGLSFFGPPGGESDPGLLKGLQIRALYSSLHSPQPEKWFNYRAEKQRRHSIIAERKKVVLNWFEWNLVYLPVQLTDWPFVDVALLLSGLTHISFEKKQFWPSRKRSIVF